MDDEVEAALRRAAGVIREAEGLMAFTGAGISVESGIPPFRGPGGVWGRYDPSLLEIGRFRADPAASWAAIREIFYASFGKAEPNAAHRVLASWEGEGLLGFLVTQNIDGLHRKAGSRRLAEFHGAMDLLLCERCGERLAASADLLGSLPPRCPSCGGLLKPDFVFFGEAIPREAYRASFASAEEAGACLVVGSTGTVYPAAELPLAVKRRGGVLIEIDPGTTEFSGLADVRIPLGASEALTRLDALLKS
ncbi:MAG TPA: Sir2 family NAD-dependent protein deacetylase [Spirochaetia bacterium]|nr:Sir2 family NAD-dependent protein deacetylase [Spirochaetales bacterium]HRY73137.1 Sir2 family NAD-dependent protein deacetylase [Spirochaetia bacterium]